jgi:hypothetical protein
MCLLLIPLLCKKRKNSKNAEPSPRPVPIPHQNGGAGIGRNGKKYQKDLKKYGPEVAEKNRKKRVGIAVAA